MLRIRCFIVEINKSKEVPLNYQNEKHTEPLDDLIFTSCLWISKTSSSIPMFSKIILTQICEILFGW